MLLHEGGGGQGWIAEVFKDLITGRLLLESDHITCTLKSRELIPAGDREMWRRR